MARLGLADRDDLAHWGATEGAAANLARLVRRAILETADGLVSVGFAAGVGVYGSGWDGTARATNATAMVPGGLSLWELSTRQDVKRKADSDFNKRTATPDGTPTTDAVYVAVSTRTWKNRDTWAREKAKIGRWREVKAYGVDDLETWLDEAPVTHAWISEAIGLTPHGLVTAERWWEGFARTTDPALPAPVLMAGRDKAVEALKEILAGEARSVTIAGGSRGDVLAFLGAALTSADDGGASLARAAYIDQVEAWRRFADLKRPLVLAPLNEDVAKAMTPPGAHHLFIPVEGTTADIVLPPIDAQVAAVVLKDAGIEERRAEEVGQLARISLIAARRRIAVKPELHRPTWSQASVPRLTRRVILLGRFAEHEGDLAVLAEVLGHEYADITDELDALAAGDDPLFVRLGATLGVVSQVDAHLLVREQLRRDDVEALKAAALKVLTEIDPRYELAPEERWQAGVLGKVRAYSSDLRLGLATTLALMGTFGEQTVAGASLTAREYAEWTIRLILEQANADQTGSLWASLQDVLSLLGEAGPDELIAAARIGITGDEPVLAKLFTDPKEQSSFYASPSHSGLVWSLETVSWSPERFGAVVEQLARWAELDPGGSYAKSRPLETLIDFFRAWFPQTSVSPERRLHVLDALRERHPELAWKLLLALVPALHSSASPIAQPRFRPWHQPVEPRTYGELAMMYEAIVERAIADAGIDAERLAPLVDTLPSLPPTSRAALYARLEEILPELETAARDRLWSVMRSEAAKNREFATAEWAMIEPDVERLEAIAARYEPDDPTVTLRYLFDEHLPSLPGVDRSDGLGDYAPAVEHARAIAVKEIVAQGCWEELYAFARSVSVVWFLGPALADAEIFEFETELIALLDSDDALDLNLSSSYIGRRFAQAGWEWVDVVWPTLSARQRARLLSTIYEFPHVWERLDGDVTEIYWREFRVHGLGPDFPYVERVVEALYGVGRFATGLDLMHLYLRNDSDGTWAELVARGLEEILAGGGDSELDSLRNYGLRELFNYLERVDFNHARLAQLEWGYLPAFAYEPAPPTLSRYLSESPEFFVDVVSRVFRPGDDDSDATENDDGDERDVEADEEDAAVDEHRQAIAANAYRLLSEWRTVPGLNIGAIDPNVLRTWVEETRARLRDARRLRIGDIYIGKMLATSPPDSDGSWPPRAVRDLLEVVESKELRDGLGTEIINSLGATSRGVLDGGDQERDKAAVYREHADALADRWPQTAAVLRDAAESFERMGRDHDAEAERRRTGFGWA